MKKKCDVCNGKGTLIDDWFLEETVCPNCHGDGSFPEPSVRCIKCGEDIDNDIGYICLNPYCEDGKKNIIVGE